MHISITMHMDTGAVGLVLEDGNGWGGADQGKEQTYVIL